jgi:hypothetical protein
MMKLGVASQGANIRHLFRMMWKVVAMSSQRCRGCRRGPVGHVRAHGRVAVQRAMIRGSLWGRVHGSWAAMLPIGAYATDGPGGEAGCDARPLNG